MSKTQGHSDQRVAGIPQAHSSIFDRDDISAELFDHHRHNEA